MGFEQEFDYVIQKMEEAGLAYADRKSKSWHSQQLTGSVLASIIKTFGEKPISRAEVEAKDSEDYRTHLRETAEAIHEELVAKAKYERYEKEFEKLRSVCSLEKKISV